MQKMNNFRYLSTDKIDKMAGIHSKLHCALEMVRQTKKEAV